MNRKRLVVGGVVVAVLVAAGLAVFFSWRSSAIRLPLRPTLQGLFFEGLLPPDVSFAMSFHPTDDAERQRFEKIWGMVLQEKKDVLLPFLATTFAQRNQTPLPLADLLELFGGNLRFTFAVKENPSADGLHNVFDVYFLFMANNPLATRGIFEKLQTAEDQVLENTSEEFIMSRGKSAKAHIGIVGDVGFLALTTKENVQQLAKRFEKRKSLISVDSLARAKDFRTLASFLSGPMSGYFIFTPNQSTNTAFPSAMKYFAQNEGVYFESIALPRHSDKDTIFEKPIFQPSTPALFAKIPVSTPIFFSEMSHMGSLLLSQWPDLKTNFQAWAGFDFEADILPFLDKNAALVLEDEGAVLPALSIWADASEASEKAKTVLAKVDEKMKSWAALGNIALASAQAGEKKPIFEMSKLSAPLSGGRLTIFADRIDQENARIPLLELITEPIEISYGLTPDNLLFFSTLPDFEKRFAEKKTVENNAFFKLAQSWEVKPGSLAFIDGAALGSYAERIVNLARTSKRFSGSEEQSYAILKNYLSPFEGFIQVGQGDGASLKGKALLKIRSTQP